MVAGIEFFEFGDLPAAGTAPGRPEIDHHRMPPPLAELYRMAVDVVQGEIERVARVDCFLCERVWRKARARKRPHKRRRDKEHDRRNCRGEIPEKVFAMLFRGGASHICSTIVAIPWP